MDTPALIVTFGALGPTDHLNSNPVNFTRLHAFLKLLILRIKLIVKKLNLRIAVTVDTPTHTQVLDLSYPVHLLDSAMARAAFELPGSHMLGMTEKNMVRQVMHPDPPDRYTLIMGIHHLADLVSSRVGPFPDNGVAVPADIHTRYPGTPGFLHGIVTIPAVDLVIVCMHHV
jgi:hypothetical protein